MPSLAHIANGELGLSVRNKLNSLIDQYNVPIAFPSGGGTQGSVLFIDGTGAIAQDNAKFFWDDSADILKLLGSLTTASVGFDGATSGTVTLQAQSVAGSWTMKLPATAGTNLYVLQTDGTGVTSWVPQSGGGGGMAIGGSITGATLGSVLFGGAAGILAQDNTNFFWDDSLDILKIAGILNFQSSTATIEVAGTDKLDYGVTVAGKWTSADAFNLASTNDSYFIANIPGLYVAPNVSGNNWFEAGAGNRTVSGYWNFGTGDKSLQFVTSGFSNVGLGSISLSQATSANQNVAIGTGALELTQTDTNNMAVGFVALQSLGTGGAGGGGNTNNIAIGNAAGQAILQGVGNVVLGGNGMSNVTGIANQNVIIGQQAGNNLGSGGATVQGNVLIGTTSGSNLSSSSSNNVWLGSFHGTAGILNNTISLSNGNAQGMLDFNVTSAGVSNTWSFNYNQAGAPVDVHIYNFQDSLGGMTNYERGILDWNSTSNAFTIGTQAGGTGTVRSIKFVHGGTTSILDYGITHAGLWTFAQATMFATSTTLTNGAAASLGTLTNAPAAGNPTKWIPINDNGITRYIPAW